MNMNNKEKLYLTKLANQQNYSVGDFFKHPAGSIGAAFSGPPAGVMSEKPTNVLQQAGQAGQQAGAMFNTVAQPLVGMAGTMWNSFAPQGAKTWAQNKATTSLYGSDMNTMGDRISANPTPGMNNQAKQFGEHVSAETVMQNGNITKDQITTNQPGTAQSPWQQALGSFAMTGNAPTRTYATGTPINTNLTTNKEEITGYNMTPRK